MNGDPPNIGGAAGGFGIPAGVSESNSPAGGLPAGVVEFNEAKGFADLVGECRAGVAGVPPFKVEKPAKGVAGVVAPKRPTELPLDIGAGGGVAGVVDVSNENVGGCGPGVVAPAAEKRDFGCLILN